MDIKFLDNLNVAKESVKVWLSNLEQLNFGNQMFAKANELDRNTTDFSKWYYGEGQTFSSFETFQVLEGFYNEMYDGFIEYINLYDEPIKKSLFSNTKEKRQNQLDFLYNDIKQKGRKLLKSLEIFDEKLRISPLFNENISNLNVDSFHENLNESKITFELKDEISEFEFPIDINETKKEDEVENLMQQFFDLNSDLKSDSIEIQEDIKNKDLVNKEIVDPFFTNSQTYVKEELKEEIKTENKDRFEEVSKLIDEQVKLKLNVEMEKIKQLLEKELYDKIKNNLPQNEIKNNKVENIVTESVFEPSTTKVESEEIKKPKKDEIDIDEEIRRILS